MPFLPVSTRSCRRRANFGFTLIELIIVVLIIAILAAIAIPSYLSYINRSKIRTAQGDLVSLALNLENVLQRQLVYPVVTTKSTGATKAYFTGWVPAQQADFVYTVTSDTKTYSLQAQGIRGKLATCILKIDSQEEREVTGCGSITSW